MSKVKVKKKRSRGAKTRTSNASPTVHVTASQVVTRLFDLFAHLGIATPQLTSPYADSVQTDEPPHFLYAHTSAIGELLTAWHQNHKYLDQSGTPAPLKFLGPGPSFRDLARNKVPGIEPSKLLSELERLGLVVTGEGGFIRVLMRAFPAFEDRELAKQHTLSSLNDFIMTLRHNLSSVPANFDQLFHRIARNDDFDRREIPALKIKIKRRGQNFLESIDDWLTSNATAKSNRPVPQSKKAKVSVGIYLSVEDR